MIFLKKNGISLIEVIIAVAVFMIGIGSVGHLFVGSQIASLYNVDKNKATLLAQEGIEAIRSIRDYNFDNLSEGNYGIVLNENKWTTSSTPDITDNKFQRTVEITNVLGKWHVTSTVTWVLQKREGSVSFYEHLTDWRR